MVSISNEPHPEVLSAATFGVYHLWITWWEILFDVYPLSVYYVPRNEACLSESFDYLSQFYFLTSCVPIYVCLLSSKAMKCP